MTLPAFFKTLDNIETHNMTVAYGQPGSGKAEWVENKIHTPDGLKRFGDLKVGDYVFDAHGKPTQVLGVYPKGELEAYKVTLKDGRTVICNDEHLWTTITSKGHYKTKTLREIMDGARYCSSNNHIYYADIPTNDWVMYEKKQLPLDPYVFGVLAGDGCLREKYLTISSNDEFIVQKVANILGYTYKKNSEHNYSWTFKDSEGKLVKTESLPNINNGKYSCEKYINRDYLESSYEDRLALLNGLLDTDGHITSVGKVTYSTTSSLLKDNIVELLYSLGFECGVSVDHREGKRDCYQININVPPYKLPELFTLPRHVERAEANSNKECRRHYDYIPIVDVKALGEKLPMMCIYVNNPEHLYLSNEFVVTHNTSYISTLPGKILVIDTDRGLESVKGSDAKVVSAECSDTNEVIETFKYADQFDSIALDNLSCLQDMVYNEIAEKYKVNALQIQHYGEASNFLISVIDELLSLAKKGKNVYIICQEKAETTENVELGTSTTTVQPLCMNSVLKHLTANSRIIMHMEKTAESKIVGGKKRYKDIYQARLGGNPQIITKITKSKELSVPQVVKDPTWEFISGLITGETQSKLKAKKEQKETKGE